MTVTGHCLSSAMAPRAPMSKPPLHICRPVGWCMPALYAAADLMGWPAVNEAYGMALLEAQAAGLSVAAGRTGGVPDVVRDGRTGALCPVGEPVAFADTVARLLSKSARLNAMRDTALTVTAAENDIAAAAQRLDSILKTTKKARAA